MTARTPIERAAEVVYERIDHAAEALERRIRNDIAGQIWRAEQEIHDVHRAAGRFVFDQNALGQLTGLQRARDIASGDNRDFE
jgi:hypothetical protein